MLSFKTTLGLLGAFFLLLLVLLVKLRRRVYSFFLMPLTTDQDGPDTWRLWPTIVGGRFFGCSFFGDSMAIVVPTIVFQRPYFQHLTMTENTVYYHFLTLSRNLLTPVFVQRVFELFWIVIGWLKFKLVNNRLL